MSFAPFAVLALGAGSAAAQVTAATGAAGAVCPNEDESMRATLNYLAVSPYGPTKDCSNCKIWSAPVAGASCGGCTLIDGAIDPHGYCDSWALVGSAAPAVASGG